MAWLDRDSFHVGTACDDLSLHPVMHTVSACGELSWLRTRHFSQQNSSLKTMSFLGPISGLGHRAQSLFLLFSIFAVSHGLGTALCKLTLFHHPLLPQISLPTGESKRLRSSFIHHFSTSSGLESSLSSGVYAVRPSNRHLATIARTSSTSNLDR